MGYLSTLEKIGAKLASLESLNKGYSKPYPKDVESIIGKVTSLYDGVKQMPKEEFGRFKSLSLAPQRPGDAGVYLPGPKMVGVDPVQSPDMLQTFLHEMEHVRQYNPDPHEFNDMKYLLAGSTNRNYEDPVEKIAYRVGALARPKPSSFTDVHNTEMNTLSALEDIGRGERILKTPSFMSHPSSESILRDLFFVKKYSGKNFLSAAAMAGSGVGMMRTGELVD